jgi:hypothetical protein
MKFSEVNDRRIDELVPALGAVAGGIAKGAQAVGSAMKPGVQAVGSAMKPGIQAASGLAGGQMDPVQAAQAMKQRQEQKQQIQDQIKLAEKQLSDLRKKLAELG